MNWKARLSSQFVAYRHCKLIITEYKTIEDLIFFTFANNTIFYTEQSCFKYPLQCLWSPPEKFIAQKCSKFDKKTLLTNLMTKVVKKWENANMNAGRAYMIFHWLIFNKNILKTQGKIYFHWTLLPAVLSAKSYQKLPHLFEQKFVQIRLSCQTLMYTSHT